LAPLRILRDRSAKPPLDTRLSDVISVAMPSKSADAPARPAIPPAAEILRNAARLNPLPWDKKFDRVAAGWVAALAQQLGERYTPARAALEALKVYDPKGEQARALDRVRGFIADMEAVLHETRGLVLYGPSGVGKDHLLSAALYHVANAGIPVGWVSGEDVFLRIRDSMDTGEREEKIIQHWLQPTVLGISDPVSPRGELKDWDARILARLIDRRYRALRPTWMSMNASNENDAREKLTAMIWDRLQDGAEIIPCFWQSYRSLKTKPTANRTGIKIANVS
jgi:DNA replication protein DnaC